MNITIAFVITFAVVFAATVGTLLVWMVWRERILTTTRRLLAVKTAEKRRDARDLENARFLVRVKKLPAAIAYHLTLRAPQYWDECVSPNGYEVDEIAERMHQRYLEWRSKVQDGPTDRRAVLPHIDRMPKMRIPYTVQEARLALRLLDGDRYLAELYTWAVDQLEMLTKGRGGVQGQSRQEKFSCSLEPDQDLVRAIAEYTHTVDAYAVELHTGSTETMITPAQKRDDAYNALCKLLREKWGVAI